MRTRARGFTLVELLVGLVLSFVLVGAVAFTFNRINTGIKNSNRSNDLSQTVRNLFILFQNDFSSAGKGVGDLATLQVHVNKLAGVDDPIFYPIADLTQDAGGFSDVTFQWFEYDPLSDPSFLVTSIDPDPLVDGGVINSAIMAATDIGNPRMAEVADGDIFLIYNPAINYDFNLHQDIYTSYGAGILWDETALSNGAIIMQASGTPASAAALGSSIDVGFGGPMFGATLAEVPDNPFTTGATPQVEAANWLARFQIKPPNGSWVARKLGSATDFREVRYYVDNGVLLRSVRDATDSAAQIMVMASNVTQFEVTIGVDTSIALISDETTWDGAVSFEENDNEIWFSNPQNADEETLVGRHGLAAKLSITVESEIQDVLDQTASGQANNPNKRRTFVTQFRVRNRTRPMINY